MVEENVTNNTNFSPYMRELQTFIARINNDFLSKFNCKKLVAESCLPIANHSIDRFVLQASLIRPVSNPAGSRKLLQGKIYSMGKQKVHSYHTVGVHFLLPHTVQFIATRNWVNLNSNVPLNLCF